ncbi:hypothetical protein [Hymenobacter terricola]|uniref:hypothetical protein n=1 Tax=Hymenobacter terricola TaxID=2819236 RepID=UPI001B30D5F6|nr:hypothetical protein [Hymenobacter terricola]
MKILTRLLPLILPCLTLAGCHKDDASLTNPVGRWKLVNRRCECAPTPTPNAIVAFTATDFRFYEDDTLVSAGTYAGTKATVCGSSGPAPALHFTYTTSAHFPVDAAITVKGSNLILDYGDECDYPVDTYELMP